MRNAAAAVFSLLLLTACAPDSTPPPLPPPPGSIPPPPPPPGHDDFAAREFDRPLSVADAEEILQKTKIFSYGGMSHLPHPEALVVIARHEKALEIARRLGRDAGPAGRLYALCLLKILEDRQARDHGFLPPHPGETERLASELIRITTPILFQQSDVSNDISVADLTVRILNRRLWNEVLSDGRRRLAAGS